MEKLYEEYEETLVAINEGDVDEIKDGLGDMRVVITILEHMIGTNQSETQSQAWNEIKDRTGKMVNGMFVKDA